MVGARSLWHGANFAAAGSPFRGPVQELCRGVRAHSSRILDLSGNLSLSRSLIGLY